MEHVRTAQVVLENATMQFDKPYTYLIPDGMPVKPGCRVTVGFGSGNRTRIGMVLRTQQQAPQDKLKTIRTLVDPEPLLSGELLALVCWLREHTFCSYYDAVRALIPPGIGVALQYTYEIAPGAVLSDDCAGEERRIFHYLESCKAPVREQTLLEALGLQPDCPALRTLCESGTVLKSQHTRRRVLDEKLLMVRRALPDEQPQSSAKCTPKQRAVLELLEQTGQASLKEICYFAAVGRNVVDRLEKAGLVRYFTQEVYRNPYAGRERTANTADIVLSEEQQAAYDRLCTMAEEPKPNAALLYGVTGSGKTEVFLRVIDHVLQMGRSVILMVPEISLTPQMVGRFHCYFGKTVAVLHSGLTMAERLDEWKRIRDGGAKIVIGTRSAVFAPLANIGLIVMDEEQESSYKSEQSPRFHARDVAAWRAGQHKALLLLASATPSIESFYRARAGRYELITLRERYGAARLPDVTILDMSTQALNTASQTISIDLAQQIRDNLQRGEQSILLLNRRGTNTLVKCAVCGTVAECPHCSVAMTFHNANGHLMCHYCGHSARADQLCPHCSSKFMRFSGAGTQKAEEELRTLFPKARILRMDVDTTMSRFSHEQNFSDISDGKYDIIIGTQMVAKGLDFPNVTLVGILFADGSLYAQDYRSYERAFSLFTQVVGRSGRAQKPGRAFIQTFTPDNSVISLAAQQDYIGFYQQEIESRRAHLYPPFCDMVGVGFSGLNAVQVRQAALDFLKEMTRLAQAEYADLPLRILGPCESQVARVAGKYRWRMAVKCVFHARTRALIWKTAQWYFAQTAYRQVSLSVDPRYESSM